MLLDTHTWIFSATGSKRLGPRAARLIEHERRAGRLVVSVASIFEIGSLVAAGRLHLERSVDAWVHQSIDAGRMHVADITAAVALDAASIPTTSLPDPVDRLLVATARTLGVPLATRDGRIIRYIEASGAGRAVDISK